MKGLIRTGPISWRALLKRWRSGEIKDDDWTRHWKNTGYASWEEWRKPILDFGRSHKWTLYTITNPLVTVPKLYGGPFKTWQRLFYGGKFSIRFDTIAKKRGVGKGPKMQKLLSDFPAQTTIFGVRHHGRIYIIDGMHRCCALSLIASSAQRRKKFSQKVSVQIALTTADIYKAAQETRTKPPKRKRA